MKELSFKRLVTKRNIILTVGAVLTIAGASAVAAFNAMQPATADVMTPTDVKVQEHDQRLDKNESDIAETKDRVSQVEQATQENTQAVATVKERVTVVERQVAAPAAREAEPSPVPTPTPKPINPRLIVQVRQAVVVEDFGGLTRFHCIYTLESGAVVDTNQTGQCQAIGKEISAQLAAAHGV